MPQPSQGFDAAGTTGQHQTIDDGTRPGSIDGIAEEPVFLPQAKILMSRSRRLLFVQTTGPSSSPALLRTGSVLSEPGQALSSLQPWENGYCESFNSKLHDELLNGEIFYSLQQARIINESWRRHYNKIRPHSSLATNRRRPRRSFHRARLRNINHLRRALNPWHPHQF